MLQHRRPAPGNAGASLKALPASFIQEEDEDMRYASYIYLMASLTALLVFSAPGAGVAGEKVASKVSDDIVKHGKARVIILMREPRLGETRSLAAGSPASFLAGVLRAAAKNISQIGTLPLASAEINADGLKGLKDNPSVAGVFEDIPMALSLPKTPNGTQSRKVQLGAQDGLNIEIADGVHAGEEVVY